MKSTAKATTYKITLRTIEVKRKSDHMPSDKVNEI